MTKLELSVIIGVLLVSHIGLLAGTDKVSTESFGRFLFDDEPLLLTPYIRRGEISIARQFSLVRDLPNAPPVKSYSGFITVNETYNSNIFFWFVPATDGNTTAPLLLWMQGGPGLTGLFGFFVEHGPYFLYPNLTAGLREFAWTKKYHVIYVDNPVGTGFSFTNNVNGYVRTEEEMADNMHQFLLQFFKLFYEYRENEFYIFGESYGGKYVPALSYKVHSESNNTNINLRGMAIGNGLCDPETMMDYGDFLYQIGLVDRKQAKHMRKLTKSIVQKIRQKAYYEALNFAAELILEFNVLPYTSYFKNVTHYNYYYNYLETEEPKSFTYYLTYLQQPKVRRALHVGNLPFQNGREAQKHLLEDIMKSVKPQVKVVMDNYRVLFYSGQLDLVIPYSLTVNFLNTVKWKHAREYKCADRQIWKLNNSGVIAGYVHNVGSDFYEVLVRGAGHVVPYDQPEVALELVSRFLNGDSYN